MGENEIKAIPSLRRTFKDTKANLDALTGLQDEDLAYGTDTTTLYRQNGAGAANWEAVSKAPPYALADLESAVCSETELAARVPSGLIVMWHGTIANIPAGWVLCDGAGGTPDLREKFVQGAVAGVDPGATGGAATHALTEAELAAHTHSYQEPTAPIGFRGAETYDNVTARSSQATGSAGSGNAHQNEPPFYDVAFIMKT